MKKSPNNRTIILCIYLAGFLTPLISFTAVAQDPVKTKSKKGVVVLKIKKEDNGKTTIIDTTFNITTPAGQKEFEKFKSKYDMELETLGDEHKDIEVMVDMADFPDSLTKDMVKQFKFIGKDEIPCSPDFDSFPFDGYENFERDFHPGRDMKILRYNHDNPTISDLLGDIPMDRVKSYSIKDRKNGKRIIIDIEDAPLIDNQERVIVIREPGKRSHKSNNADRQMKVIINSDDSNQNEDRLETPPSPPPPPPKK